MSNVFTQNPPNQTAVAIGIENALAPLLELTTTIGIYPSKLVVEVIRSDRPEFGQLYPR